MLKLNAVNALILGAVAYVGYRVYEGQSVIPSTSNDDPGTPSPGADPVSKSAAPRKTTKPVPDFPMSRNSRGQYVKLLQQHLGIGVDGIFGNQTENALLNRHAVKVVTSLAQLQAWISAAKPNSQASLPASKAPVRVVASTVDLNRIFDLLWMSVRGKATFVPRQSSSLSDEVMKVLGGYSDKQLYGFMVSYYATFKARSRPGVLSLVSDLKNVFKNAMTADITRLINRLVGLKP